MGWPIGHPMRIQKIYIPQKEGILKTSFYKMQNVRVVKSRREILFHWFVFFHTELFTTF